MKLRPLSQIVVTQPVPRVQTSGGILLPESVQSQTDGLQHRVLAAGTKVPFDIKPGATVLFDPNMPHVRVVERDGEVVKLVPWVHILAVIGGEA